eukprot:12934136-Alexandrium_andersonii.AAC.1
MLLGERAALCAGRPVAGKLYPVGSSHSLQTYAHDADLHTRAASEPARAVMLRSRPRHEQGLAASRRAGDPTKT